MKLCKDFELVSIAEEYMVVPVGDKAESFNGVVVLNDEVAFLLKNMQENQTIEDLVGLLTQHYEVETDRAYKDIADTINTLYSMGIISE